MARLEPSTIYDVAQRAGVSTSTVSHVVNGTRRVAEETRKRVEDAIAALSFRPNNAARVLREGRARLIGLVLPDISNTFFADLAHRIEMLAYEQDARVVTCNSDYDQERERAYVDDLVRRRVDGIIIAPVIPDAAFQAVLEGTGLPTVVIDRVAEGGSLPSVAIDNAAGAELAAEHLHALGHRHIGCITYSPGLVESVDHRTRGFVDSLARLGVALPEDAIAHSDFRISGGMDAASRLLAARPDLTALFCANDLMAVGAVRAASLAGRSVPGDLSIIGFDNSLEAQISQPPLTTVAQPLERLAAHAIDLLRPDHDGERTLRLSAKLVVRQSTAPVARAEARPVPGRRADGDRAARQDGRQRILVVGAGRIGRVHARALSQTPNAVIAGICDSVVLSAEELASDFGTRGFPGVEEALACGAVDGVVIGSPSDTHLQLIKLAARHGVHVFCEKPLALTRRDIEAAIAISRDADIALQVGFNRRFDPNAAEIAASVHQGRVGTPLTLRITSRDPAPPPRDFIRRSGGMFHDMSIHDFDLARFIMREEVTEVMAMGGCLIDPVFAEEGDVDVATITLRFASGAIAIIENTRATPYGYDQRIEVLGTTGALESENQTAHRVIHRDGKGQRAPLPLAFFLERYETAFRRQMQAFIDTVSTGSAATAAGSGADALSAFRIAEAAAASLRQGRPITIEEPGNETRRLEETATGDANGPRRSQQQRVPARGA
jgi:myo-inositol 2-dehydrogenase/D-chiro-inositol 1-dehydrogenase